MPSLGKIEEFSPDSGNILRYLERLDQYFEANGVPKDSSESQKRRAILISVIGAKAYDVLSDLCSPAAPKDKSYDQLATILRGHYAPKKLVIAERYRFHNCTQREGESVSTFAANLKRLASTCNFGSHLTEALRDRFVCGLRSKETQKKLLTEEHSFDEALKTALSFEVAVKDVAEFKSEVAPSASTPLNKFRTDRPRSPRKPRPNSKPPAAKECLSCGKSGHARSACKYRDFSCHSCGKSGHIAVACKKGKQKIHQVAEQNSPQAPESCSSVSNFSASLFNVGSNKGIEIPVEMNGQPILMELDTGAGLSLISLETYKKHFSDLPLEPSTTTLKTYTGHPVPVSGKITTNVQYQDQQATLPLCVVDGTGPSLIGRDWLTHIKLDWKNLFSVRTDNVDLSNSTKQRLSHTIHKFPDVFKSGLGTIKGITAKLELKDGAKAKFCKARPVPYALQESVETEYDRLEAEGIVERVEFSDWATPMVHVPKASGATRSC